MNAALNVFGLEIGEKLLEKIRLFSFVYSENDEFVKKKATPHIHMPGRLYP